MPIFDDASHVNDSDDPTVTAWLTAVQRPEVSVAMEQIEQDLQEQIDALQPVCLASGRCCQFREFGHRLYTTGLETVYCLRRLAMAKRLPGRDRLSRAQQIQQDQGGCMFLGRSHECTIHAVRPFGCRLFYCDRSKAGEVSDLHERVHRRIAALHDAFEIEYEYAEWSYLLSRCSAAWPFLEDPASNLTPRPNE